MVGDGEARAGVSLTNLDQPLFAEAAATKRDLVDYLDAVSDRLVPELADRPLSVVRVHRDQSPFMQKNVPRYTPDWVRTVTIPAHASHRDVRYALCNDRRTLLWFANQRAVEYHPTLTHGVAWDRPTHLVLDLDPPGDGDDGSGAERGFAMAVRAARLVRQVLADAGMAAAVKASGAKGVHVVVPLTVPPPTDGCHDPAVDPGVTTTVAASPGVDDVAAATRAIAARAERLDPDLATTAFLRADRGGRVFVDSTRAGGATVVSVYSPRVRPGVPVSFPLSWDELDGFRPGEATIRNAADLLAGRDRWRDLMPGPQTLDPDLVAEGRAIPVARVQAMHEGKRRARARRSARPDP